ncbi:MAG: hypothetical protein C4583_15625 [Anaerolineaceae bacterium]|nr:MAG: hypothetical protein C4583_15625 [Anaerolineaceae bacterium]
MSAQLVGALKAASVRMSEQRRELRRAQVLLRIWPEGLVFACNIPARNIYDLEADGRHVVGWDELLTLTPARAIEIVDDVCRKAAVRLASEQGGSSA